MYQGFDVPLRGRPLASSRSRRIVSGGPALEILEAGAPSRHEGAPLLLVHGAFAGAWCWEEVFLPFFAKRGRYAAAVSLRGHGASEGGAELKTAALDDLAGDLRRAIAAMPSPPVVIAHSLGGYLAQLLLGRAEFRALALLGALPPDGMALVGPRLALSDPMIWFESMLATVTQSKTPIDLASVQLLFGEGVPSDLVRRYAARMIPEGPRALAEAHVPRPVVSAYFAGVPSLVINGGADRLVWPAEAVRSALYHGAEYREIAGAGHFLMLDPEAEMAAGLVIDWLDQRGL